MNEDFITDLKQFIAATIAQQLSGFATKDDLAGFATKDNLKVLATKDGIARIEDDIAVIKNDITGLNGDVAELRSDATDLKTDATALKRGLLRVEGKVAEISESIGDALSVSNDSFDEQLKAHVRLHHSASA